MPIVAETRPRAIALRFVLAAFFLAGAGLVIALDDVQGFKDVLSVMLAPVLAAFLLGYRVRERMVLDVNGLTLHWSPLSVGPFPLVRREAFVPWGRVRSVHRTAGYVFFPASPYGAFVPRQYIVRLSVDGRRLTWRLGWHTSSLKEAVTYLATRSARGVVEGDVQKQVREWKMVGVV